MRTCTKAMVPQVMFILAVAIAPVAGLHGIANIENEMLFEVGSGSENEMVLEAGSGHLVPFKVEFYRDLANCTSGHACHEFVRSTVRKFLAEEMRFSKCNVTPTSLEMKGVFHKDGQVLHSLIIPNDNQTLEESYEKVDRLLVKSTISLLQPNFVRDFTGLFAK